MALGCAGHGVSTTARTSRPAARAASTVSSEWLIVPSPGRAATTTGQPRSTARSRIV